MLVSFLSRSINSVRMIIFVWKLKIVEKMEKYQYYVLDKDSGLNGKVICSFNEDVPFTLSPSTQDNMYAIVTKSHLDREKQAIYDVRIIAKDAGVPSLSSEKSITIVVSDVNDNSPEFSMSPYTFYVPENNSPGASLFSVRASDRDEGDNSRILYHILRDGKDNTKVHSFNLNINSENGDILALKSFDFETLKTFQFQVVATDSGAPSLRDGTHGDNDQQCSAFWFCFYFSEQPRRN
uniref:Cadherin domain-containing protein n=1 Tax=Stegastes partitus TaxID=144197 RepID=A0A3B4Z9S4_9TELE